ncbi:MAG: ubiquinone/menaquinone biosynthesis methyltransferase [Acidobacteriaceae bacterium]
MRNSDQATGSRPAGASDEASSARAVREMFDRIAPRYDLLNHVLSCNVDRLWWWRTARRFRHILARPQARVLDICCGTGDMTMALLKRRPTAGEPPPEPVVAADFAPAMLERARKKLAGRGARVIEADALHLPMADGSLDLITTAFGFRNLANYQSGLEEFFRVLAPGGEVGILDCSEPDGLVGKLYSFYFRRVLPVVGKWISGDRGAYGYLPESVKRFPRPEAMLAMMRQAGFVDVEWTPFSFGIVGQWRGVKR